MSQQKFKFVLMALLFCLFQLAKAGSDEGMYPVSEIGKLNLAEKGLELTAKQIFDSESVCFVDGICRVNGCTGSFVSPSGLIITNHHCAYRAIQSVSTTENDYLADGFQAKNLSEEIPAPGYTVRVTESFEDVSKLVLSVVTEGLSFSERTAVIDRRTKEIEKRAEENHPGMRAEVAEMFAGKTYVLFLYTYIKDVRLVFAPPSSIGNFGGDVDNWEWPRHTGDFSFMRAYVAPDGSSAEYSAENVPYRPKRHIQVAMEGANEGEFVMILGYPGRTARHKTASFLSFERDFRLPNVVENYGRQMATMTAASDKDRSVALKLLSRMRSLANVEKRSRGQLKGLKRASIVQKRKITENELQAYIDQDPARKFKYGDVLPSINSVYQNLVKDAQSNANFTQVRSACQMARIAFTIFDAANEKEKPDLERESAYMDRNMDQTRQRLFLAQKDLDIETDKLMLKNAVSELNKTSDLIGPLEDRDIDALYSNSNLHDSEFLESCFDMTIEQLNQSSDSFLVWMRSLYPKYLELREQAKRTEGELSKLYGDLVTIKQEFQDINFIPDANATLRLTYGTVRGYSPEDAVYCSPATTLSGVVAKTTGETPFVTPKRVLDLHAEKTFGKYAHPKLNDIPVAILYDTDTTGGNSGSPVLNGKGELVGVNFDRAFEATINDFAWNTNYSRSIGVDIRYVLWVTDTVYGAGHLIEEMGLSPNK